MCAILQLIHLGSKATIYYFVQQISFLGLLLSNKTAVEADQRLMFGILMLNRSWKIIEHEIEETFNLLTQNLIQVSVAK